MQIMVNGAEQEIISGQTIGDLLKYFNLAPKTVVVEYNKDIIGLVDYDEFVIADGASIELIRFVGGG